jgi:hypothetical protein
LNISPKTIGVGKAAPDSPNADVIVVYNQKNAFHPIVPALRNNGYTVRTTLQFSPELYNQARVVIFIPEKGFPMDIMFFEEENEKADAPSILKIFLLNAMQQKKTHQNLENDILFLDRKNLDLRFVLHTLDRFLGKVVIAEKESIEAPESELLKGMP